MNPMQNRQFGMHLVIAWLLAGSTLALLLPVSPGNHLLGWSGVYWLLGAPILISISFVLRSAPGHRVRGAMRPQPPNRRCSMRRRNSAMMSR